MVVDTKDNTKADNKTKKKKGDGNNDEEEDIDIDVKENLPTVDNKKTEKKNREPEPDSFNITKHSLITKDQSVLCCIGSDQR